MVDCRTVQVLNPRKRVLSIPVDAHISVLEHFFFLRIFGDPATTPIAPVNRNCRKEDFLEETTNRNDFIKTLPYLPSLNYGFEFLKA